jgi:hypothetical protein
LPHAWFPSWRCYPELSVLRRSTPYSGPRVLSDIQRRESLFWRATLEQIGGDGRRAALDGPYRLVWSRGASVARYGGVHACSCLVRWLATYAPIGRHPPRGGHLVPGSQGSEVCGFPCNWQTQRASVWRWRPMVLAVPVRSGSRVTHHCPPNFFLRGASLHWPAMARAHALAQLRQRSHRGVIGGTSVHAGLALHTVGVETTFAWGGEKQREAGRGR